jgi:phenylpyruvate tautomerase PptA (4-oxalocrotonate tautomerase family)
MPFANIKGATKALSKTQKEEIMHRMTDMLAECFNEAARPHAMILIGRRPTAATAVRMRFSHSRRRSGERLTLSGSGACCAQASRSILYRCSGSAFKLSARKRTVSSSPR